MHRILGCLLLLIACSDSAHPSDAHVSRPDAGAPDAARAIDAGPATAPDAGGPLDAGVPGSPVLRSVTLVEHGVMELTWENPASGCSNLTINRKRDAGAYEVAQTVAGVATSAIDMPGHASGTYCYTVACTLGSLTSTPSNERCVTQ